MRVKIFLMVTILSACLVGCSNVTVFKDQNDGIAKNIPTIEPSMDAGKEDNLIPSNTSEPFVGSKDLDSETEKFFYGTWKVENLLGFANSYNDASEYLSVSDSSTGLAIPVSFLDVNNDRLILILEATQFELKRVTE
ncbi:hypothetical protein NSQ91_03550 [Paenibacillus sp. FSL R7-0048]|uniref:hypothetical protein n=1 Tax=Paenibacillus sp. FSL R7-0048 TaxID=2954528 RepID=UPI0030F7B934